MRELFRYLEGWTEKISLVENGAEREARAFIQPVSVTNPDYMGRPTPAGTADDRRYLLIAESAAISEGKGGITVRLGDRSFEVLRCELMGGGSHWEGIMRLKAGGGDA